jgi:hypothetical protein
MGERTFDKPARSAIIQRNLEAVNSEVDMKSTRSSIVVVVTSALLPVVVGEELQPVG